jgi:hypothetical protein
MINWLDALKRGIFGARKTTAKTWEEGKAYAKEHGITELETAMGLAEASYHQGFIDGMEHKVTEAKPMPPAMLN